MLQLKDFQQKASTQIADRFMEYYANPSMTGPSKDLRRVPFFQALASITASGKTVILTDAVAAISTALSIEPVIIWLSKGRVVVEQTYANLSSGGNYNHLLGNVQVATLAEFDSDTCRDTKTPLLYFATVGTFNQKDKELGARLIFKTDIEDSATASVWQSLKNRLAEGGQRRPLLVVYDEAQNLSDQQTDLLLELQPDAFIVASATMKIPIRLSEEINRLKADGWTDQRLVTDVDPTAVVANGLIKSTVLMAGYEAPMEETVTDMLGHLVDAREQAAAYGLPEPKAIYVCKTNIVEGDAFRKDDPKRPFSQREAPPIVIWRYLTETHDIDPARIAVYASLKFDRSFPPPPEFILFAGADKDYDKFTAGDYTHIIFNLGLQEGWDDPMAYFAYVDKSMESNVAIEQVIGRLLRQPGAHHYPSERLNTAHFYVRVDKRSVFKDIMDSVTAKLEIEAPEVRLVAAPAGKPKPVPYPPRKQAFVHEAARHTNPAVKPIEQILATMSDWRIDSGANTKASGGRTMVQRNIGKGGKTEFVWEEFEHTNEVSARWIFQREVMRRFPLALGVATTHAPKFDAMIGFNSSAYEQVIRVAGDVVDAYVENVVLKQKRIDPYEVGPALMRPDEVELFQNSIHEGYSGLNTTLELPFARALDKTGYDWCRNPSQSGYGVPLITHGATRTFYPDFLVWVGEDVFALDTTAPHLLLEKTGRKLLSILPPKGEAGRLWIRFISKGKFNDKVEALGKDGYTVWGMKQDGTLRANNVEDLEEGIGEALQVE